MRFYFLYIFRRWLKGYPYDIPASKINRVVFPLYYIRNFCFAARMDDSYFNETKVSRAVLQSLFLELYLYLDGFMLLWMHVFSIILPMMITLKVLREMIKITESSVWILYIPLWFILIEIIFSMLVSNGLRMTKAKIEKFFETKRDFLDSLHISFSVPPKHCLWIVLLMNDDGERLKDSDERGGLVSKDEGLVADEREDEPDTNIEL